MVLLVSNHSGKKLAKKRIVSGSGFFSNLWSKAKKVLASKPAQDLLKKGLNMVVSKGSKLAKTVAPAVASQIWTGAQKHLLRTKDEDLKELPKFVTKSINKGLKMAKSTAKNFGTAAIESLQEPEPEEGEEYQEEYLDQPVEEGSGLRRKKRPKLNKDSKKILQNLMKGSGILAVRR